MYFGIVQKTRTNNNHKEQSKEAKGLKQKKEKSDFLLR